MDKVNKQLYQNSGLKELFADNPPDGHAFFNSKEPNLAIQHEKPEHRMLLWMKCQGASNREISQQSGYTEAWLSQLFRQPWAQARLVQMMTDAGQDVVHTLLETAAPDSVLKLIEVRDDPKTPKSVVRAACVDLLEQYMGKPKQRVDVHHDEPRSQDVAEIDQQIEQLEKEENRLRGLI